MSYQNVNNYFTKGGAKMNKFLITTAALIMFSSTTMAADFEGAEGASIAEAALKARSAQSILNEMACKDKEPSDVVKDQTDGSTFACGKRVEHDIEVHSVQYGDKKVEDL